MAKVSDGVYLGDFPADLCGTESRSLFCIFRGAGSRTGKIVQRADDEMRGTESSYLQAISESESVADRTLSVSMRLSMDDKRVYISELFMYIVI